MSLVVDASMIVAWLLPDEAGVHPRDAITRHGPAIAPNLFNSEIRNVLLVNERRGRLRPGRTEELVDAVGDLGVEIDMQPSWPLVMTLARRHTLTVYDALYLELALRRGAALATLDRALGAAAVSEGVLTITVPAPN